MKLRLEFDDKVGVFTVIGYYKDKRNRVEWSLLPCKSIALFAALPVTSRVIDAVILRDVNYDQYSLTLTIINDNKEELHIVVLSDVPKTVNEFPIY